MRVRRYDGTSVRLTSLLILLSALPTSRLFAQCPDGAPPPCAARSARPAPPANSVAVLPFENRARDTAMTLLAEGLADQITTDLGKIARLQVSSPSAVRSALARGTRDPARIGTALGARWLVDGQLLSGRGTVRISVQLVEASRGTLRWSNSFQRPTDDLLGLIRSIADSVATAIVGELAPAERAQLEQRPTGSAAAYESYLRGRATLRQGSGQNLLVARALFEEALSLDSTFVNAWAALASTWVSTADNLLPPRGAYPQARRAAQHALQLEPTNGEATAALAKVAMWYDWDGPGALLLARRAEALDPASAETHLVLGLALVLRADTAEAMRELLRSLDLDSLSGRTVNNAALGMLWLGQYDAMIARGQRVAATDNSVWGYRMLNYAYEAAGRCADADAIRSRVPDTFASYLCAPPSAERTQAAIENARGTQPYFRAWGFARWHAAARRADQAMELLEQSLRDREAWMPFIRFDPSFRPIADDPRFQDLVRRVAAAAGRS